MPRYYRKIIRITADDSPNVRLAKAQIRAGMEPTNKVLVPGVLTWDLYLRRLKVWDKIRQCIGLEAQFYEGKELLLYPPLWRNRAIALANQLKGRPRKARAIGIDTAEGGDDTAMSVVDELGLIELVSKKTPNTAVICNEVKAFARKHNVEPHNWLFDRGGGGKQHADRLRDEGYPCRTIAFGETLVLDPKRGLRMIEEKIDNREERYTFYNRRSQMFGELSIALDPDEVGPGFAIPAQYDELHRQMSLIPKVYDKEGRLRLPSKNKNTEESKERTLIEILGCSPDELDSLALAHHGMIHEKKQAIAGAF